MPTRERPADRGRRRARDAVTRLIRDGREARIAAGLSLRDVGQAVGCSHSRVRRIETGFVRAPSPEFLGAYCAVVGLDLVLRAYPAGDPLRDRAQLALLERLRARTQPSLLWRVEVPLPREGDLRAWDADVRSPVPPRWRVRFEAETVIADGQALERRLSLKMRDDPDGHTVLVVADTRANRWALRNLREGLRELLPLDARAILAALGAGADPRGNGLVLL